MSGDAVAEASIVAGYLEHQELCADELPIERFFMNVALSRVLYAHALVARPELALGRLPAYAWTNDERHPWTATRGRRIMPVLTWLTS